MSHDTVTVPGAALVAEIDRAAEIDGGSRVVS